MPFRARARHAASAFSQSAVRYTRQCSCLSEERMLERGERAAVACSLLMSNYVAKSQNQNARQRGDLSCNTAWASRDMSVCRPSSLPHDTYQKAGSSTDRKQAQHKEPCTAKEGVVTPVPVPVSCPPSFLSSCLCPLKSMFSKVHAKINHQMRVRGVRRGRGRCSPGMSSKPKTQTKQQFNPVQNGGGEY